MHSISRSEKNRSLKIDVVKLLAAGASAISLLPCCSGFRGLDCDEVPPVLLGTCGTVVNTVEHMDACLESVPIGDISTAMNDPSPFTLLAFLPRFTFFFDISMSFFEEIAKFRAGRRIWARIAKERLGAEDPRSWRLKFHGHPEYLTGRGPPVRRNRSSRGFLLYRRAY